MNVSREPGEWKETVLWYRHFLKPRIWIRWIIWTAVRRTRARGTLFSHSFLRRPVCCRTSAMEVSDLHPPDDYSHRFFIWHEWIQVITTQVYCANLICYQANGPLTSENVFEYFTTSMFYDKQSNNQVLRMQTMHTGTSVANEAEELK